MNDKNFSQIVDKYINDTHIEKKTAEKFAYLECCLFIFSNNEQYSQIDKLYISLRKMSLILKEKLSEFDLQLNNLSNEYPQLKQAKFYTDILQQYANWQYDDKIFHIDLSKKSFAINKIDKFRIDVFNSVINKQYNFEPKKISYLPLKEGATYCVERGETQIKIKPTSTHTHTNDDFTMPIRNLQPINISMKELYNCAKIEDEMSKQPYRENLLKECTLYNIDNNIKSVAKSFEIKGVVHLAGVVSAGKSTLSEALAYYTEKNGYRIVILEKTYENCVKRCDSLKSYGIKATVVAGKTTPIQTLIKHQKNEFYPSKTMTQSYNCGCYINGYLDNDEKITFTMGEEPCYKISELCESDKKKSKSGVCPFYGMCSKTKAELDNISSNVIVCTPQALATTTFGANKTLFLEYVINNIDLMICDEADEVLNSLDDVFCTTIDFNKLYNDSTDTTSLLLANDAEPNSTPSLCSQLRNLDLTIKPLHKYGHSGFSDSQLKSFTALSLLNLIFNDEEKIQDKVYKKLSNIISKKKIGKQDERTIQAISYNHKVEIDDIETLIGDKISELYKRLKIENIDEKKFENMLTFLTYIIVFENVYHSLINEVQKSKDIDPKLRNVLSYRHSIITKFIPTSPIGNSLHFSLNKDNDTLTLTKQDIFGRALLTSFPKSRFDDNLNSCGPNVLMMSGTGVLPLSYAYNIPVPVSYLLKTSDRKKQILSKIEVECIKDYDITISGVKNENKKRENIELMANILTQFLTPQLAEGRNILISVNSYQQAKDMTQFFNKYSKKIKAKALSREKNNDIYDDFILKDDVEQFNGRILIVPYSSIERGYNIVDKFGNSYFHTLIYAIRPTQNPTDFQSIIRKVNGKILSENYHKTKNNNYITTLITMQNQAFKLYNMFSQSRYSLNACPQEIILDFTATMFNHIQQMSGRLYRINQAEQITLYPKIQFLDNAFFTSEFTDIEKCFKELKKQLDSSKQSTVTSELYDIFFNAIL